MTPQPVSSQTFRTAVERLRVPGAGTEVVAPLLSLLVRFTRPRRVLEVGMGYTTPFLAATLAELEAEAEAESRGLAAKTLPYVENGHELDDDWLDTEPALLSPHFYARPYRSRFIAVDDLSLADSSAARVGEVLREIGLDDRVTVINAGLRDCIDLLPRDFTNIDLAWVDAWECLYFFDYFWELINPDGGLVIMHYLMTYPEGEAVLDYIAKTQRAHPGELEMLSLLEPHKLAQNSVTVLRRTAAGKPRPHAGRGGQINYGGLLPDEALAGLRIARDAPTPPTRTWPRSGTPAPATGPG
jgi:predicted O-methyltransferase YrrM